MLAKARGLLDRKRRADSDDDEMDEGASPSFLRAFPRRDGSPDPPLPLLPRLQTRSTWAATPRRWMSTRARRRARSAARARRASSRGASASRGRTARPPASRVPSRTRRPSASASCTSAAPTCSPRRPSRTAAPRPPCLATFSAASARAARRSAARRRRHVRVPVLSALCAPVVPSSSHSPGCTSCNPSPLVRSHPSPVSPALSLLFLRLSFAHSVSVS